MINGLRKLNVDLIQLKEMTMSEYQLRMTAARLQEFDRLQELATASFFNRQVMATDDKGKYLVTKISQLVDIEEIENQIFNEHKKDKVFSRLREIAKRVQQLEKEE